MDWNAVYRVIAHANTNFANKQMKFFFSCSSNTVIDSKPPPPPFQLNEIQCILNKMS